MPTRRPRPAWTSAAYAAERRRCRRAHVGDGGKPAGPLSREEHESSGGFRAQREPASATRSVPRVFQRSRREGGISGFHSITAGTIYATVTRSRRRSASSTARSVIPSRAADHTRGDPDVPRCGSLVASAPRIHSGLNQRCRGASRIRRRGASAAVGAPSYASRELSTPNTAIPARTRVLLRG